MNELLSVVSLLRTLPLLLVFTLISSPVSGQYLVSGMPSESTAGNIDGFSVVGKGSATALPNRLEIDVEVSAASELSADAIVKYRDAKRRLQDAFDALQLGNVTVEERGLRVGEKGMEQNPYYFDYQPNRRTRAEVQLSRKLVVTCSEIRDLDEEELLQLVAKLLDVAQDAGAQVGPGQNNNYRYYYDPYGSSSQPGLVRFVLEDFEAIEEQVYEKAIADARAQASRLAKLSQVELGPIVAVRIASSPEPTPRAQNEDTTQKRLESSTFQEIPVRVDLMVRFNIAPIPKQPDPVGVKPAEAEEEGEQ